MQSKASTISQSKTLDLTAEELVMQAADLIDQLFGRHELLHKVIVRRIHSIYISLGIGDMLVINLYQSISAYNAERHTISHSRLVASGNKAQILVSQSIQCGSLCDLQLLEASLKELKVKLKEKACNPHLSAN